MSGKVKHKKVTTRQKQRLFRDLDRADSDFAKRIAPFLDFFYKYYFRVDVQGWENVPPHKTLFVGNHNGMITFEVMMLFYSWYQKYGLTRRAVGLAHGIALDNPFFRWICPRVGAVPADFDVALEALARDYSVLVYPGGEKEAFRPFHERKKVDFFQRKGFIRLALQAKVPIQPIVSVGAHESYDVIWRGEWLAEKLGLKKKYRLHGVPITFRFLFFLWFLATSVVTIFPMIALPAVLATVFVPLPTRMQFRVLPPIDIQSMVDPAKTEDENLQVIYDHVVKVIQDEVARLYSQRKLPVLG